MTDMINPGSESFSTTDLISQIEAARPGIIAGLQFDRGSGAEHDSATGEKLFALIHSGQLHRSRGSP